MTSVRSTAEPPEPASSAVRPAARHFWARLCGAVGIPAAALVLASSFAPARLPADLLEVCTVVPSGVPQVLSPDTNSVLQVYLDAHGLVPGLGGRLLLLGTNNHLFRRLPDGRWRRDGGEELAGAVVDSAGAVSVVPSPLPGRALARPRAISTGDGGWSVVFLEADLDGLTPNEDNVRAAWYGEIRDAEWTALERLPLPVGRVPAGSLPASLTLQDSQLFWAVPVRTDSGPVRVAVFERTRDGEWSVEVLPTILVGSLDLAVDPEGAPVLAVVHPDRSLPSDGSSLFLWHRRGGAWVQGEKLVPSQREQVFSPVLAPHPLYSLVAWVGQNAITRNPELRVMPDFHDHPRASPLTIGPPTTMWAPPVPLWIGGEVIVVSEHVLGDDPRGLAGTQLLISRISSRAVETLHSFPSGFIRGLGMASAAADDSTIVIAGTRGTFIEHPLVATGEVDGAVREVHTELHRIFIRCPARAH